MVTAPVTCHYAYSVSDSKIICALTAVTSKDGTKGESEFFSTQIYNSYHAPVDRVSTFLNIYHAMKHRNLRMVGYSCFGVTDFDIFVSLLSVKLNPCLDGITF